MMLVIGGYFQGKKQFLKDKYGFNEKDFSSDIFSECPVVIDFESYKGELGENELKILLLKEAIVAMEGGNSVISGDKEEREHTEKINRTLNLLANEAETVIRVFCGIPIVLKGKI